MKITHEDRFDELYEVIGTCSILLTYDDIDKLKTVIRALRSI